MDNSQTSPPAGPPSGGARAPARRRKTTGKRTAKVVRRAPAKRSAPRRRKPASSWKSLVDAISSTAVAAGTSVATASGEGLARARHALEDAGSASRKAIASLARQWKTMDSKKRAGVLAALAAALAAASAPVVTHRIKKK